MSRFKKFAMLLVLLFFAAFAVAQTNTARLSGTVSDSAGAVVSGGTVTVKTRDWAGCHRQYR